MRLSLMMLCSVSLARQKASNLAQPISYASLLPYTKFWYSALCLAPLALRSSVAKPDAAYVSAPLSRRREVCGIRLGDRLVG